MECPLTNKMIKAPILGMISIFIKTLKLCTFLVVEDCDNKNIKQ